MKRFYFVFFAMMLSFFCAIAPISAASAEISADSLIMTLAESHDEDEINVDLKMVTNTGVYAMALELVYDKNVFEYLGYERGEALEKLDLMQTDLSKDKTLPVKFSWLVTGRQMENDDSVGVILKLKFALKQGAKRGKYSIGFKYNDGNIAYIANGNVVKKSAIIGSKVSVSVAGHEISDTEIVENTNQEDGNGWLIAGIAVASAAVIAIVTILIIRTIKKKRGTGNWSEI